MRIFFALELPDTIKEKLTAVEKRIKECGINGKYIPEGNLHLTLLFLGETKEVEVKILSDILAEKIVKGSIKLKIEGLGAFRNGKIPRVLYTSLEGDIERLVNINMMIERYSKHILARNKLENKFVPHITLLRIEEIGREMIFGLEKIIKESIVDEEFIVEKIALFESILLPGGSEYRKIGEIRL